MNILNFQQEINFYWTNCFIFTNEMAKRQLWIAYDREKNVTRGKIVFLSVHSHLFLYKFVVHFDCSTTCSNTSLWRRDSCCVSKSLFKKPRLLFLDFMGFVAWVELTFWCSPTQVFCFVYLRDLEHRMIELHDTFPSSVMKICHNACTDRTLA